MYSCKALVELFPNSPATVYNMTYSGPVLGLFLLLAAVLSTARSANIAVYGGPGGGSHFMVAASLGEELLRRGHNVTAVISGDFMEVSADEKYSKLFHFAITNQRTPADIVQARMDRFTKAVVSGDFIRMIMRDAEKMRGEGLADCDAMLMDQEFIQRLREAKFDFIVMDPWFSCMLILPEILDIRYALLLPTPIEEHIAGAFGSPTNLALSPSLGTGFPQRMSFLERLENFLRVKVFPSAMTSIMSSANEYRKLRGISPTVSARDTIARAELLLVNMDYSVEFASPIHPNVIPVGGITTRPANPLPVDLEEFLESSGEAGVIVFSLGSYATFMEEDVIYAFSEAFSQLPQKVIWKFTGTLPENTDTSKIRIMKWIPQNDLLAHPKTKLIIFQGGNNGFYEVVDHGVPSVVIPLLMDQYDVASRVVHHGMGVQLDYHTLNADKIIDAVMTVITNESFKTNAKRVSGIFRDQPSRPVEKAAFWIEHVLKHGGGYLKSPVNELTWYQYNLLDVGAFLAMSVILILIVLLNVMKLTWRLLCCLCGRKAKVAKTD